MKRSISKAVILLLALCFSSIANAATLEINWEFSDDQQHDIDGFKIFYGHISHNTVENPVDSVSSAPYANMIKIDMPGQRTYSLNLEAGTYYFRMTAFKDRTAGFIDSKFSNEVFVQIGVMSPVIINFSVSYP